MEELYDLIDFIEQHCYPMTKLDTALIHPISLTDLYNELGIFVAIGAACKRFGIVHLLIWLKIKRLFEAVLSTIFVLQLIESIKSVNLSTRYLTLLFIINFSV